MTKKNDSSKSQIVTLNRTPLTLFVSLFVAVFVAVFHPKLSNLSEFRHFPIKSHCEIMTIFLMVFLTVFH